MVEDTAHFLLSLHGVGGLTHDRPRQAAKGDRLSYRGVKALLFRPAITSVC